MGRHRQFDEETVLDAALAVFWRKGYDGTSYEDLVSATGVKPTALYSAFGNKQALFVHALERYHAKYMNFFPETLALPRARDVAEQVLRRSIELNTRFPEQRGCLVINGALSGADDAAPLRQALLDSRAEGEAQLRQRFERAKAEGDLPQSARPEVLAGLVAALLHGIAVQAKAGSSRDMLEAIAEQGLAGWPEAA